MLGLLLVLTAIQTTWSQGTEFSPYSRHGLGMQSAFVAPAFAGMGGLSGVAADGFSFSSLNPASAGTLVATTFQVSGHGTRLALSEEGFGDFAVANTGGIGPMELVLKRNGGKHALMFGLHPGLQTGYAITQLDQDENAGVVEKTYDGMGGLSMAHMGWSKTFRGTRFVGAGRTDSIAVQGTQLHLGGQVRYLFGAVTRTSRLDILDPTFLDNRTTTAMQHRAAGWNLGLVWDQLLTARYGDSKDFEKSMSLRVSLAAQGSDSLITDYRRLSGNTQTFGGVVTAVDTAYFAAFEARTSLPIATQAGLGLLLDHANGRRILLGLEWRRQDWTVLNPGADDALGQTIQWMGEGWAWGVESSLRVGGQWKPGNAEQRHPFWGAATYRLGFAQSTLPMTNVERNASLQAWQASAGLSVPMRGSRSASKLHFGMEFGQRSMADGMGLQEQIMNIHVGFTLNPFYKNIWLTPRLYD